MNEIIIKNAQEGCLKNVSLNIPKNKLVVFTGLSGSGKSTLLFDVLFNECQRLYLEALSMQGISKPKVDSIKGASPTIAISQEADNRNPRSTLGTITNLYTDLRMIYEKLGVRECPYCHQEICSADCKEEVEKTKDDFKVFMMCSQCGKRMEKLVRTHFSFNTKEGACPKCEGLGVIHSLSLEKIFDESKSLEEGAIKAFEKQYGLYQMNVFYSACAYYQIEIPVNKPLREYSMIQKELLTQGVESNNLKKAFPNTPVPKTVQLGKFEGVIPNMYRRYGEKEGNGSAMDFFFENNTCDECHGERLNTLSRSVHINGIRLPECNFMSIDDLVEWISQLEKNQTKHQAFVLDYILDIKTKCSRLQRLGLGYLTLDRQTMTLSGGEYQRLRLSALLDSELTGVIYILDEPTSGLHPKDTKGLLEILRSIQKLGNTVLVIEHDEEVMKAADLLVELGPNSGKLGGEIVAIGNVEDVKKSKISNTGKSLSKIQAIKTEFRSPQGHIHIENANKFNLKNITIDIPIQCLTTVTGPSGSGKSTLIFEVLSNLPTDQNGLENFHEVCTIHQTPLSKMRRSNVATILNCMNEIRDLYAKSDDAKTRNLDARHFSFNTKGGRCENCEGLGFVESNLLFFKNNEITCPVCQGKRFKDEVLEVKVKGYSIYELLQCTTTEVLESFSEYPKINKILRLLQDVGLEYLELGQLVTTLSKGEAQRLKLARELLSTNRNKKNLYLIDEPTAGLHPCDIEHFLVLLNKLVDEGNTVVVVEHNHQIIQQSDWIIDLGKEGGKKGGQIMFEETPLSLLDEIENVTANYLRKRINQDD